MKPKELCTSWYFWLFIITSIAIAVRSIPSWMNAAWGGDFGIYYGLTSRLVENQQLFGPYNGWGGMYNYFPVLYITSALGHWVTGINLLWVMPKIAPVFGGLCVLVLYFIVYEMTKRRDLALLSSLFLAVIPFHVYQTSHAAPLTMGHFFMLLSLYLFLKTMTQKKYMVLLLTSTMLLIMSHHLTTYFYLISLFAIVVIKSIHTDLKKMHRDIAYVVVASVLAFSYWMFVATPVFTTFMNQGTAFQSYLVVILFYVLLFSLLLGIAAVKKYRSSWMVNMWRRWTHNPDHTRKRAILYFIAACVFMVCAEVVFLFMNFPGNGMRMKPLSMLYSIPMVLFIGFGCMGLEYFKHVQNRWFFQAWLCAILLSFFYSLLNAHTPLYPDRHIEYLTVPACLFASVGVLYFFSNRERKFSFSLTKQVASPWIQGVFALVVSGLVFSNAMAVYPVYTSLDWMDESIPDQTVNAIYWMKENLDVNSTVVATDLRLSKMLWAEGINATFESTNATWTCPTWGACVPEFEPDENHSLVTHVLIDDVMRDTSVNVQVIKSVYMTNDSYLKFKEEPFELVYRNVTLNQNLDVVHWAEIYRINWTCIHEYVIKN